MCVYMHALVIGIVPWIVVEVENRKVQNLALGMVLFCSFCRGLSAVAQKPM